MMPAAAVAESAAAAGNSLSPHRLISSPAGC